MNRNDGWSDWCRIVVGDGTKTRALGDGAAVGRTRQIDKERLVGLIDRVASDRHRHRLRRGAGSEVERARGRHVVGGAAGAGRCRAIRGGVVHGKGRAAGVADREGGDLGSRVTLCDGDVVDRDVADARRGVVVGDGADALASTMVPPLVAPNRLTKNVSSGSTVVSPLMVTEMVLVRSPAAKLTVPVGCAT